MHMEAQAWDCSCWLDTGGCSEIARLIYMMALVSTLAGIHAANAAMVELGTGRCRRIGNSISSDHILRVSLSAFEARDFPLQIQFFDNK